jgi:hypothetical protein
MYNEAVFGTNPMSRRKKLTNDQPFKRDNKNRPLEMSSKKPQSAKKEKKPVDECRDPRFSEKSGYFNDRSFRRDYGFVQEIKNTELDTLKEKLTNTKDGMERKNLKFLINRMDNQNRETVKKEEKDKIREKEKARILLAKKAGQMPYYVKKSEQKTQELVTQYKELKNSGRLKKHIEKRRKKSTAKDRKKYSFD